LIVLDTHVLLWWVGGDSLLSAKARSAIQKERTTEHGQILISAISAWEIAMLVEKGRLTLSMSVDDWLAAVAEVEPVSFVPIDNATGVQSVSLPDNFHKDPGDRLIVALARHMNAPLLTSDEKIKAYKHVRTIW
jgi:PIN domain nuclease of toxin-antitoxin system